jgi:hypothetical protein
MLGAYAIGCGSGERDPRTFGPYVVAMKSDTPPALEGPEASVFQVKRSVALPLSERPPNLPATPPYPRPVWFTPEQLRVQVDYVVTNLEARSIQMELLFDGWNEFIYYSPQVRVVDDEVIPDRSCVQRPILMPAKGRAEGRVSFDDFERMAIALAGITNNAENPGHLLDPSVNLRESPLATKYIPSVISGITGFDVSIRTAAAARIAVEVVVELIDRDDILMEEEEEGSSPNRRDRDMGRRQLIPVITTEEG